MLSGEENFTKLNGDGNVKPRSGTFVEEASLDIDEVFQTEEDDCILTLNISGMHFQVTCGTLARFPGTLLGDPICRQKYFNYEYKEYFFERSRLCFDSILYYYQSKGVLCCPRHVPPRIFHEEVQFFLGKEVAKPFETFGGKYSHSIEDGDDVEESDCQRPLILRQIWNLFDSPNSSTAASVVAVWSLFVIAVSVATFCIETIPSVRDPPSYRHCGPFFIIESLCISWFTIELLCRFISCPNKLKFIKSFLNIIDLVAILPYFMTLPLSHYDISSIAIIRVVRLIRIFQVFKLSRYSNSLVILARTLWESAAELSLLFLFLSFGIILFASAIYYAEHDVNSEHFTSIPDAFWWATITMTTVGYGDKYPVTVVGKFIGSCCAIVGVLFVALPIPVIVQNFTTLYEMERDLAARKASKPRRQKQQQSRHYLRNQMSEGAAIIEDFRATSECEQNNGTGDQKKVLSDDDFEFALSDRRRGGSCVSAIDAQNDVSRIALFTCPHCGSSFQDRVPRPSSTVTASKKLISAGTGISTSREGDKALIINRQNAVDISEFECRYSTGNLTSTLVQILPVGNENAAAVAETSFQNCKAHGFDDDSVLPARNGKLNREYGTSV
ncbi:potassium voltage-gated channel subfamily A member 7-like [Corticium candelabrum]|uniref:potassium voltage-gated channel subfamily A member 7-like n=1 Tax=Corticium candelabrum TaxID=121492 RepID=UPI002E2554B9|nr:potassium voltage-gated channel subfamily A member 7-like [Corticium candelabrum]